MSLLDAQNAILVGIRVGVPGLRTCQAHGGRVDEEEIRRWSTLAPAVFLVCLGCRGKEEETGEGLVVEVEWACFLMTRDTAEGGRGQEVIALADRLLATIHGNRWGGSASRIPRRIEGRNLYAGKLDRLGVALWVVGWTQGWDLGDVRGEELPDFRTFHADLDLPGHEPRETHEKWSAENYDDSKPDTQDTVILP